MKKIFIKSILLAYVCLSLAGCGIFGSNSKAEAPKDSVLALKEGRGSLTGGASLLSLGGSPKDNTNSIGVNSFLWRATLDTLSFMPLASADPFGGVIITDWYEDPKAKGERFKVNALIIDKALRSDGVRVTLFKQKLSPKTGWHDIEVNKSVARDLEDTILTRARELRVSQGK
ncbi:MAG: DUF3576 domain-containing protein [Pseudomonadota bacterium]